MFIFLLTYPLVYFYCKSPQRISCSAFYIPDLVIPACLPYLTSSLLLFESLQFKLDLFVCALVIFFLKGRRDMLGDRSMGQSSLGV